MFFLSAQISSESLGLAFKWKSFHSIDLCEAFESFMESTQKSFSQVNSHFAWEGGGEWEREREKKAVLIKGRRRF